MWPLSGSRALRKALPNRRYTTTICNTAALKCLTSTIKKKSSGLRAGTKNMRQLSYATFALYSPFASNPTAVGIDSSSGFGKPKGGPLHSAADNRWIEVPHCFVLQWWHLHVAFVHCLCCRYFSRQEEVGVKTESIIGAPGPRKGEFVLKRWGDVSCFMIAVPSARPPRLYSPYSCLTDRLHI